MPGRGALLDITGVHSEIRSIQQGASFAGAGNIPGETSEIGGDARKGSDAYDRLQDPNWTRIDAELVGAGEPRGELATKGQQGIGPDGTMANYKFTQNAVGRTFGGSGRRGRRRAED